MTAQLGLGIVGLGTIAQVAHLPSLRALAAKFDVQHVCDLSAGLATHIAGTIDGPVRTSTDLDTVLADANVDAVLILTPGAHGDEVLRSLDSGKHVFVEKPLCISIAELRRIHQRAVAQSRYVQVGYMKNHEAATVWARAQNPRLGRLRLIDTLVLHPSETSQLRIEVARYDDVDAHLLDDARTYDEQATATAIGEQPQWLQSFYRDVALGSLVHQVSAARFVAGAVWESVEGLDVRPLDWFSDPAGQPPSLLAVGTSQIDIQVALRWRWIPEYPSYTEHLTVVGDSGTIRVNFAPPYEPTRVARAGIEDADGVHRFQDSADRPAFEAELSAFHGAVVSDRTGVEDVNGVRQDISSLQRLTEALGRLAGHQIGGEAARSASALGTDPISADHRIDHSV